VWDGRDTSVRRNRSRGPSGNGAGRRRRLPHCTGGRPKALSGPRGSREPLAGKLTGKRPRAATSGVQPTSGVGRRRSDGHRGGRDRPGESFDLQAGCHFNRCPWASLEKSGLTCQRGFLLNLPGSRETAPTAPIITTGTPCTAARLARPAPCGRTWHFFDPAGQAAGEPKSLTLCVFLHDGDAAPGTL
jgi:hypothetical protein